MHIIKSCIKVFALLSTITVLLVGCSGNDTIASGAGGATSGGSGVQSSGGNLSAGGLTNSRTSSVGGGATVSGGAAGVSSAAGANSTGGVSANGGATAISTGGTSTNGGGQATGGLQASGGTNAVGGATTTGGAVSVGGSSNAGTTSPTAGATGTGGMFATGGSTTTGGTESTGGSSNTGTRSASGGAMSTGGVTATGGMTSAGGGSLAIGGTATNGGSTGTGGSNATGGALATGGTTSTGGSEAVGGTTAAGGATSLRSVTGNWRFTIADSSALFAGYASLVQGTTDNTIQGHAIDTDGIATLSGTFDATTGNIQFTKNYIAGISKGLQYKYSGTVVNPSGIINGSWTGTASSDIWSATLQTGYAPSVGAGAWTMLANWGTGTFQLAITNEGYATGTMSDTNGSSNLDGIFDLGNGSLFFRKVYTSGTTYWYFGTVNAAGTAIVNGTWGNLSSNLSSSNNWAAVR